MIRLKDVYQHCMDMQKLGETKNIGLLSFNSAILLLSVKVLLDNLSNLTLIIISSYIIIFIAISICLNIYAIAAQLAHKEIQKENLPSDNLLFFGAIANYQADKYLNEFKSRYNCVEDIDAYYADVAKQIVINSQIALNKFKLFNQALKWTLCGIFSPLAIIIFCLFFDRNR